MGMFGIANMANAHVKWGKVVMICGEVVFVLLLQGKTFGDDKQCWRERGMGLYCLKFGVLASMVLKLINVLHRKSFMGIKVCGLAGMAPQTQLQWVVEQRGPSNLKLQTRLQLQNIIGIWFGLELGNIHVQSSVNQSNGGYGFAHAKEMLDPAFVIRCFT
ncbi:hypothetical protein Tco_0412774 [Tanacetum coccineum]